MCILWGSGDKLPCVQAINAEMPYHLVPPGSVTERVLVNMLRAAAVSSRSAFQQAANQGHADVNHHTRGQIPEPQWPTWQLTSAHLGRKQSHCRNRASSAFAKQYQIARTHPAAAVPLKTLTANPFLQSLLHLQLQARMIRSARVRNCKHSSTAGNSVRCGWRALHQTHSTRYAKQTRSFVQQSFLNCSAKIQGVSS